MISFEIPRFILEGGVGKVMGDDGEGWDWDGWGGVCWVGGVV